MRYFFYYLGFLLILVSASDVKATALPDSISYVFVREQGKASVEVLQLKNTGTYDHSRYTPKRVYHDYGVYEIRHGKITFESNAKKREFSSVAGRTYYISGKGLFKTKVNALTGKESVMKPSDDPKYFNAWDYNPLTGKTIEESKQKPKLNAAAEAAAKKNAIIAYTKNYYVNLTATYVLPYKGIMEKSYCGPDCYSTIIDKAEVKWVQDTSAATLFNDFETVMHETIHRYNSEFPTPGMLGYLVEPGIEITVIPTETFRSAEVSQYAPEDASQKIFRYNTYLSDSSRLSTNVTGIYGLMDEFSAYHNGVRACVIAAQNAMAKGDTARAAGFISQAAGTYFAYYEFNLFIAWYLHTAKANYPEKYSELLGNNNLRLAYTLLDADFKETVDNLKRTSSLVQEQTGYDYLAFNEKTYAANPKQMLTKEKNYLESFKVKGATKSNYFTYVR
jgi:hypothetical protein